MESKSNIDLAYEAKTLETREQKESEKVTQAFNL